MNLPIDPADPLLQILAEEAADLPLKAAEEARQALTLRVKRRRQIAVAVAVLFCSVCVWQFFPQSEVGQEPVAILLPPASPIAVPETSIQPLPHIPEPRPARESTPLSPQPHEFAIVRTEAQARNEPLPLPEGLTTEQASVVKAARGLPLLLVRDRTGKVARIHVIER